MARRWLPTRVTIDTLECRGLLSLRLVTCTVDYEEVPPPLPCILNAGRSLLAALLWLLTRVIIEVGECRLLVLVSSRQVRSSLASLGLPSPHLFVCAMDLTCLSALWIMKEVPPPLPYILNEGES